ncbi:MAG TPA: ArsI/CadI family heavy metal resistance metalloenzyme [Blastocatellia bacterium]|nr:ArsI/CadI family heavy metal resistance metalloenzyme [Blastocatellia bacterium]
MNQLKVHLALNVNDVERSVQFYRTMFAVEPVKHKPGYAKFDIANPALNLSLNYKASVEGPGALNHLGIQLASTDEVLAAKARLEQAGLATFDEMGTDCCYALQDKVWVTDPDGYRWEYFVVNVADTQPELSFQQAAAGVKQERNCCGPECCA